MISSKSLEAMGAAIGAAGDSSARGSAREEAPYTLVLWSRRPRTVPALLEVGGGACCRSISIASRC